MDPLGKCLFGKTPLHEASKLGNEQSQNFMVYGKTPLYEAAVPSHSQPQNSTESTHHRVLRSDVSMNIRPPVPGYPKVSSNQLAEVWNTVPGLQSALTLGEAKAIARKWARTIPR